MRISPLIVLLLAACAAPGESVGPETGWNGATGVMFGSSGGQPARCERTLIFREGRVAEQNWQGPSDYCSSFRR